MRISLILIPPLPCPLRCLEGLLLAPAPTANETQCSPWLASSLLAAGMIPDVAIGRYPRVLALRSLLQGTHMDMK